MQGVLPNATLVASPDERIEPMLVVTMCNEKPVLIGQAKWLLDGKPLLVPKAIMGESQMASLGGKRTSGIDAEVGLKLLEAFGASSPEIGAQFGGAKEISFSFENVKSRYVDTIALGRLLEGRRIDLDNPCLKSYQGNSWPLLVIDTAFKSNQINVTVSKKKSAGFKLDVSAIEDSVGKLKTGVSVVASSDLSVSFKRKRTFLGFAFRALRFYFDADGMINTTPPSLLVPKLDRAISRPSLARAYNDLSPEGLGVEHSPDPAVFFDGSPGLIDWDEDLYSLARPARL